MIPNMVCCQEDTLGAVYKYYDYKQKKNIIPLGKQERLVKLFSSGNLDYISGGMLRSSAKVIEINIGDPDKFYVPLYFMVGALSQPTEEGLSVNYITTAEMLNNNGGLWNIGTSIDRTIRTLGNHTEIKSIFQFAIKAVSGVTLESDESVSMYTKMFLSGLQLDTKAWKTDDSNAQGRAWLKTYISYSLNDSAKIFQIFGGESVNNFIGGNIECGLNIKAFADIRFGYHRYINNQQIDIFREPMYVFSANFALDEE